MKIEKKKGKVEQSTLIAEPSEDVWMRNLSTSPAAFLHRRFEQESDEKSAGVP